MVCLCINAPKVAAGTILTATPSDYLAKLGALGPGDTLVLAPGEYTNGLPVHDMVGVSQSPIVIEGPLNPPYARFPARLGAHTISVANSAHVAILNL